MPVTLQLVTPVDYIETINRASTAETGNTGPALFVVSSELLDKARLAGLTVENDSFSDAQLASAFPQKAIDAATCGGKLEAYPFYFETCFLLYNRHYTDAAPATIDDILAYSDTFEQTDATANVENIFKWNVNDIFYNFFFIANYVNLGGPAGDDKTQVSVDADEVVQCLQYFQSLNSFFAIDDEEVTTDDVLQEFIDGKTVYTIAKTDAIAKLDQAIAEGSIPEYADAEAAAEESTEESTEESSEESTEASDDSSSDSGEESAEDTGEETEGSSEDTDDGAGDSSETASDSNDSAEDAGAEDVFYGISKVPGLTADLQTKGLSVTNSVVVNAYSSQRDLAKEFAKQITYDDADQLYSKADKMSVKTGISYDNSQMQVLLDQYDDSVEVTKITDLSNYWIWMELTFEKIWTGSDVQTEIDDVSQKIAAQLE